MDDFVIFVLLFRLDLIEERKTETVSDLTRNPLARNLSGNTPADDALD